MTTTLQLRRYEIAPGHLDEFVDWWREHLWPARLEHGFSLVHAAADHERSEFVWAVTLPVDEAEFRERDAAWETSPERLAAVAHLATRPLAQHASFAVAVPVADAGRGA